VERTDGLAVQHDGVESLSGRAGPERVAGPFLSYAASLDRPAVVAAAMQHTGLCAGDARVDHVNPAAGPHSRLGCNAGRVAKYSGDEVWQDATLSAWECHIIHSPVHCACPWRKYALMLVYCSRLLVDSKGLFSIIFIVLLSVGLAPHDTTDPSNAAQHLHWPNGWPNSSPPCNDKKTAHLKDRRRLSR
jgi:hypothetical protein